MQDNTTSLRDNYEQYYKSYGTVKVWGQEEEKDSPTLTPSTFEAACKKADWYFQYSDDHKVYCAGRAECMGLYQQAKQDDTLMEIFLKYSPFPTAFYYR